MRSSAKGTGPLAENVDSDSNMAPIAHAGEMQVLAYEGSPVAVRLDGSRSIDSDGTIASYRWLSGNAAPDGGVGRVGPDPEDEVAPTVMLDAGLLERERRASWAYYRLRPGVLGTLATILGA